jgi:hypothetical protein
LDTIVTLSDRIARGSTITARLSQLGLRCEGRTAPAHHTIQDEVIAISRRQFTLEIARRYNAAHVIAMQDVEERPEGFLKGWVRYD